MAAGTVAAEIVISIAVELCKEQLEGMLLEQEVKPAKEISGGTVTRTKEFVIKAFTEVKETVSVEVAPIELLDRDAPAVTIVEVTDVRLTVRESTEK